MKGLRTALEIALLLLLASDLKADSSPLPRKWKSRCCTLLVPCSLLLVVRGEWRVGVGFSYSGTYFSRLHLALNAPLNVNHDHLHLFSSKFT